MAQNVGQTYRVTVRPGGPCCDVAWVHTEVGWRVGGTTGEEYGYYRHLEHIRAPRKKYLNDPHAYSPDTSSSSLIEVCSRRDRQNHRASSIIHQAPSRSLCKGWARSVPAVTKEDNTHTKLPVDRR